MASNSDLSDLSLDDLIKVIEDVGKIKIMKHRAPCPLHGGKNKSFSVFMGGRGPRWRCHSRCQTSGDAIEFVKEHEAVGVAEAYEEVRSILGISNDWTPSKPRQKRLPPAPISTNAPPIQWSNRALSFCRACRDALWEPVGQEALDLLRERGLSDKIIRDAWLGYNPYSRRASRESWGLERDGNRQMFAWGHSVVIPWFVGPSIWRVRFRQMGDVDKGERYRQLAGCGNALYLSDSLKPRRLAVVTEGEIDALSIRQHAPADVAVVATGGVSNARRGMWISKLALCSRVLLAFDDDTAGHGAAEWWVGVLPNARRWLLPYGDANDYVRSGGDIEAWLAPAMPAKPKEPIVKVNGFDFDDGLYKAVEIAEALKSQQSLDLYLRYEDALIDKDVVAAMSALEELRALKTTNEWRKFEEEKERIERRARNAIYL